MAFTFVKFPKKYLLSEEWHKPRKYTRAEALLYLVSESEIPSIGYLAKVFQWSKSTVHSFINEMVEQGFIERKSNDLPNENRTYTKEIKNITPLILSSTKVESNIYPPKGEMEFLESVDFEFRGIVQEWLAYKRERKESYKSLRSMQAFVAKLRNLSQNNATVAQEIIHQSMANNWAGIFALKTQHNEKLKPTNHTNPPDDFDLARAVAEGYARANTPQGW